MPLIGHNITIPNDLQFSHETIHDLIFCVCIPVTAPLWHSIQDMHLNQCTILASTLQPRSSPDSSWHDLLWSWGLPKPARRYEHVIIWLSFWHDYHSHTISYTGIKPSLHTGMISSSYQHTASNVGMIFLTCLIVSIKVSLYTVKNSASNSV